MATNGQQRRGLRLSLHDAVITRVDKGQPFTNEQGQTYPAKIYIEIKERLDAKSRGTELAIRDGEISVEELEKVVFLPINFDCAITLRTFERNTRIECHDVYIQVLGRGGVINPDTGEKTPVKS